MTIAERIADADFLLAHDRKIGALTMLMVAIAGSSRKRFPRGTRSIKYPGKDMKDGEAFEYFLGGRIADLLLSGGMNTGNIGPSGISIAWQGRQLDLAYLLYKLYRNSLIHEGALSAEAKVVPDTEPAQPGAHTLSITVNNRDIHINEGALPIFREAVVDARCNGAEFGRRHFDFENREALTETLLETVQEFGTSVGRLMILSRALLTNPGYDFNNADDATCAAMIVGAGGINGGAMTGLASHQLADRVTRTITPKGIAAFRAVAAKVNVVEVFQ